MYSINILYLSIGVFILNLVCRDEKLRELALTNVRRAFQSVCAYKLDEDVNEILYCRNVDIVPQKQWRQQLESAAKNLNDRARQLARQLANGNMGAGVGVMSKKGAEVDDLIEVDDFLKSLTL